MGNSDASQMAAKIFIDIFLPPWRAAQAFHVEFVKKILLPRLIPSINE
jgi:hypothetical protein